MSDLSAGQDLYGRSHQFPHSAKGWNDKHIKLPNKGVPFKPCPTQGIRHGNENAVCLSPEQHCKNIQRK